MSKLHARGVQVGGQKTIFENLMGLNYWHAEYQLEVYGSLEFDRDYAQGCRSLISELKLEKNVALKGLGKPTQVLAKGWVYLQVIRLD